MRSLRLFLPALASLCVSCGGGGSNESQASSQPELCTVTSLYYCPQGVFQDPFGIALAFAWYSGQCSETQVCASDPAVQAGIDESAGTVTEEYVTQQWRTSSADETEPNNQPDQADVFLLGSQSGFLYDGTLNDTNDLVDYLVFSVEDLDGTYHLYLCASQSLCTEQRTETGLYLSFYDQNLALIQTTQHFVQGQGQWLNLPPLSQGLRYYIGIHATQTGEVDELYRMVVTD